MNSNNNSTKNPANNPPKDPINISTLSRNYNLKEANKIPVQEPDLTNSTSNNSSNNSSNTSKDFTKKLTLNFTKDPVNSLKEVTK